MIGVYPLSHLIVEDVRRALIAEASVHVARPRRLPFGVLRGARWLWRAPRRAAAPTN